MKVLFSGSFNPVTTGHLDVAQRASALFDGVVLGVLVNPEKTYGSSIEERAEQVRTAVGSTYEVSASDGLAVELMNRENCAYLLRGIRTAADYRYEREMAKYNKGLGAVTLYLLASPALSEVSSTAVREGRIAK